MTKKEAKEQFIELYLNKIPMNDGPMLAEAWNEFTDYLCKNGEITEHQYNTWTHPVFTTKDYLMSKGGY